MTAVVAAIPLDGGAVVMATAVVGLSAAISALGVGLYRWVRGTK